MLNLNILRERSANGEAFEYFYFWGHTPPTDGSINKACLSQWYAAGFDIDNIYYKTAEHWMMACKARLFNDSESLEQIIDSEDPKTAKALGRKVANFDDTAWKANARQFVTDGNVAKFSQNSELGAFLLGTGNTVLVEASPRDCIWGIGLGAANEKAKDPATWRGQNLLGFALMDVRATIENVVA